MPGRTTKRVSASSPGGHGIAEKSRASRQELLRSRFPSLVDMTVLDLGGTPDWWRQHEVRPAEVTVVNLKGRRPPESWMTFVRGDACAPPAAVANRHFDLVFSNSLIEHVGGHHRRQELADVVHALGDHHFVETPYRYFPMEPHWMFPGFQFLPTATRSAITRRWSRGHVKPAGADRHAAMESVLTVELLPVAELAHYFPDSTIVRERYCGLTKAIIAVR